MTGQSKHQAWPDKQYAGQAELFEEYECDLQTWLIERGYHEWMKLEDPRKYPRVDNARTVTRADDPSGRPIGTRLRYESARDYQSRCDRYKEKAMKIWAKAMRGYTADARSTALQAPRYEPQALFDIEESRT